MFYKIFRALIALMIRGQIIRFGSFIVAINESHITNTVLSEKMGSQKMRKILRRPTVHVHRENVRRAIGLARGRSAALKSRGYFQRKTRVFKDVCSLNIHRRLKKLQRLIPGGSTMQEVDVLFKKTADYIVSLKMQVCLLRAMSNFCTSNTYSSP